MTLESKDFFSAEKSRAQQVSGDNLPGTILVEMLGGFDEKKVGGQTQISAIDVQESAQCKSCYLQCASALNSLGTWSTLLCSVQWYMFTKRTAIFSLKQMGFLNLEKLLNQK